MLIINNLVWILQTSYFFPAVFILRTYAIYGRGLIASGVIVAFLLSEVIVKLVRLTLSVSFFIDETF